MILFLIYIFDFPKSFVREVVLCQQQPTAWTSTKYAKDKYWATNTSSCKYLLYLFSEIVI